MLLLRCYVNNRLMLLVMLLLQCYVNNRLMSGKIHIFKWYTPLTITIHKKITSKTSTVEQHRGQCE